MIFNSAPVATRFLSSALGARSKFFPDDRHFCRSRSLVVSSRSIVSSSPLARGVSRFLRRKARGDREWRRTFSPRGRGRGGGESALILAMLFHPCRGQAMVCTVVLSAAALASQTHYSYLNEFSRTPFHLFPSFDLLLAPRRIRSLPRALFYLLPSLRRSHRSLSIFAITSLASLVSSVPTTVSTRSSPSFRVFYLYFFHGSSFTLSLSFLPSS